MDNVPSGFFAILGLCIGSFLNVCIYRMPRGESLAWPGSRCPACGRPLGVSDLAPVVSYLALRGRCRSCGTGISPRYPLVEAVTGAAFWWAAESSGGDEVALAGKMLLLSGLIVIFFIDLEHWIIPDKVVYPLAAAGLVISGLSGTLTDALLGAAAGFFGFWAIALAGTYLAKKEAMGGGDIKMAGMLGCFLGLKMLLTGLFMAFLVGSLVSLPLLALRRRGSKDPIPFGPMLAVGAAIALVKGDRILAWYGDWIAGAIF